MPLRVRCQCGETLTMPENKAGMKVMCPLCDQLITIPPSPKVVTPPPPKSSAPVAPIPAKERPPTTPAARQKSQPVVPPPLEKVVKESQPVHESTAATKSTPLPIAPKEEGKPSGDASRAPGKGSHKPIPKPRRLSEQPVPSPAKPPGPPPRKNDTRPARETNPVSGHAGDSHAPVKAKRASETSPSDEAKKTPVPPPLNRDGKSSPPPDLASKTNSSPIAPVKAPPILPAAQEPEPQEVLRGVEHDPGKKWTVYQLGCCLAVLALVGMIPGILEVIRHTQDFDSKGVESWAYFVFFFSGIQISYAIYMVQLPDWSTARVVMVVSAMVSVLYATCMGVALMAGNDNAIIAALGLTAQQKDGYVSPWCCMMTLLMSLLTYFLVRTSLRWQRVYELATAGR